MKKYIILTALILLSISVQAREKGFRENLISSKKQGSTFLSREEAQTRRNVQMERMKERYNKKYIGLSKEELEKHKARLEQAIQSSEKNNKQRLQSELDIVNSLLNGEK